MAVTFRNRSDQISDAGRFPVFVDERAENTPIVRALRSLYLKSQALVEADEKITPF